MCKQSMEAQTRDMELLKSLATIRNTGSENHAAAKTRNTLSRLNRQKMCSRYTLNRRANLPEKSNTQTNKYSIIVLSGTGEPVHPC